MEKFTTLLSTSALALLLGTNFSYGSDLQTGDGEEMSLSASTTFSNPAFQVNGDEDGIAAGAFSALAISDSEIEEDEPEEDFEYDPRDLNHDGHVSLMEKIKYKLDVNHDGVIDWQDVKDGFAKLWAKVKGLFMRLDTDNDGYVEFDEIVAGTQVALNTFAGTIDKIQELSAKLKPMLEFLPENIRLPFEYLLGTVDNVAETAEEGVKTAKSVRKEIATALKNIRGQLDDILDGDVNPQEISNVLKTAFAYLEMIKGADKKLTGDNKNIVTSLERKLAEINATLQERGLASATSTDDDV